MYKTNPLKTARRARIKREFYSLKPYVDTPFYEELSGRWPDQPTLNKPVSQMCTGSQIDEQDYIRLCLDMQIKPRWHRKF